MDKVELTDEQKAKVVEFWNSNSENQPTLTDITNKIFGPEYDGRSRQGKAIKAYLAEFNIKPKPANEYRPKSRINLTPEQMEFIQNNCGTMSAVDMARVLFTDNTLTNLNIETITIAEYLKSENFAPNANSDPYDVPSDEWKPPNTMDRAIARVNKYVLNGIDRSKLTNQIQRQMKMLVQYLHNFRFINQINNFDTEKDRSLFESTFIRYTYDKPDLTEEEVDQYILLATEAVMANRIQARSERLQAILDNQTNEDGEENARIAMSLVEAIGKAQQEYNSCVKRQQDLVNSLKEKRSDRMSKQLKENASILNLVEAFKQEEKRIQLIRIAELQKKTLEEEVGRLTDMEDVKIKILGLTKNEAING